MLTIKHIKPVKSALLGAVAAGLLFGISGCWEKEAVPVPREHFADPFGLFKIHLTLLDVDSKEPLSDLQVKLVINTFSQINDPETVSGQVTDSTGLVHITIAAAPPIPQEFVLSVTDTTKCRSFQQKQISVRFIDPVFIYRPKDATIWGKLYQGTAELNLTRELKQTYDE